MPIPLLILQYWKQLWATENNLLWKTMRNFIKIIRKGVNLAQNQTVDPRNYRTNIWQQKSAYDLFSVSWYLAALCFLWCASMVCEHLLIITSSFFSCSYKPSNNLAVPPAELLLNAESFPLYSVTITIELWAWTFVESSTPLGQRIWLEHHRYTFSKRKYFSDHEYCPFSLLHFLKLKIKNKHSLHYNWGIKLY